MAEERHLITVIKKPTDKVELLSIIDHYKPQKISVVTYKDFSRINSADVAKWFTDIDVIPSFYEIDREGLTAEKFIDFLDTLQPYQVLALPIGNLRAFYKCVPVLRRKRGKDLTIVHISDGVIDAFQLFQFCVALRGNGLKGFMKAFYSYFEYKKALADTCFFQLYPLKAALAKDTLPVLTSKPAEIPEEIRQKLADNRVDTLLLPGWGETVETLLEAFPEVKNYCATTKELKMYINREYFELEDYITGEDVIKSGIVKQIVGTASSAVYFAKLYDKNIGCKVLLNGVLNKTYGSLYEKIFKLNGEKLSIEFKIK